jgi:hypothetical protein
LMHTGGSSLAASASDKKHMQSSSMRTKTGALV